MERLFSNKKINNARQDTTGYYCNTCQSECQSGCINTCGSACYYGCTYSCVGTCYGSCVSCIGSVID